MFSNSFKSTQFKKQKYLSSEYLCISKHYNPLGLHVLPETHKIQLIRTSTSVCIQLQRNVQNMHSRISLFYLKSSYQSQKGRIHLSFSPFMTTIHICIFLIRLKTSLLNYYLKIYQVIKQIEVPLIKSNQLPVINIKYRLFSLKHSDYLH